MNKSAKNESTPEPMTRVPGKTVLWEQSWRELLAHFKDTILARAKNAGLDAHSQEDVLQESMVTLIRAQHGLEPGYKAAKKPFGKWFSAVVHHRIQKVRREGGKEDYLPPATEDPASPSLPEMVQLPVDIEQKEEREWARARLAGAMRKLQRRVSTRDFEICVALLNEESIETIAAKHDMKPNAVYQVSFRFRQMINAEVEMLGKEWEKLNKIET